MFKSKLLIDCIDTHTGGEPLRIVTSGFPKIQGNTILEKRKYVMENLDDIRKLIMLEPRGHNDMYGCILVEPVTEDGDFGVLFTHNEGLSTMCGHGIISVTKTMIELGRVSVHDGTNEIKIDSPAGRIVAYADYINDKVENVRFQNVPCFVFLENIEIELEYYKNIVCNVVYCGAFYIYVNINDLGLTVEPQHASELVKIAMMMKCYIEENYNIVHPIDSEINGIYGSIFMEDIRRDVRELSSKNVCVFAQGQIDRSPTGTGTGGRIALLYKNKEMTDEDVFKNYSIIDTLMEGRFIEETEVDGYPAIITEVSGTSNIMGINQLVLDPDDPLPKGFRIW